MIRTLTVSTVAQTIRRGFSLYVSTTRGRGAAGVSVAGCGGPAWLVTLTCHLIVNKKMSDYTEGPRSSEQQKKGSESDRISLYGFKEPQ